MQQWCESCPGRGNANFPQTTAAVRSSKGMDDMTDLAVSTQMASAALDGVVHPGEDFVRAFNEVRAELVSTLFFVLGNHEDAQEGAQDAFRKCWRPRDSLADVRNMRAWIFRVGLNAAKDLQRNAWRRKSRPMTAGALGLPDPATVAPADALV